MQREMRQNQGRKESGFTILEVLIGISILVIGLLGVASMQVSAIRGNYFSANTTLALTLAEDKMEELLSLDFTHADLTDSEAGNNSDLTSLTTVDSEETNVNESGQPGSGGRFHRIWNIRDETGAGMPTMKTITVLVAWDSDDHVVRLTSMKHQ